MLQEKQVYKINYRFRAHMYIFQVCWFYSFVLYIKNDFQEKRDCCGSGNFSFAEFFYLRRHRTGKENIITREEKKIGDQEEKCQCGSKDNSGWVLSWGKVCKDSLSREGRETERNSERERERENTPGWGEQAEEWRRNLFLPIAGIIFKDL